MLHHAAMIHVIGATELDDLRRRAPHQKMVMIPNGSAREQLATQTGPRQEAQPPSILYCGRHNIEQKGLDLLLDGFAIYRRQGGTLQLVLIGGGSDTVRLRALARELGVAGWISWPGILPVNELRSMLQGGAAFVHTSRFDVLPTACLEAAALGLPLFTSQETNFADYILPRNAGWICRSNVPVEIASTMFLIERTSPAERIAMGENARRMIDEELRWDLICEKLGKTVEEIMKEAARAR
jgi:glycosyltransferase involved in cell wall biosynthesis